MDFAEEFKEHLVQTEREVGFLINQNRVSSIDYLTRHQEQICELKRASYAKLVPISDRSLLVIGGQQQSARSS